VRASDYTENNLLGPDTVLFEETLLLVGGATEPVGLIFAVGSPVGSHIDFEVENVGLVVRLRKDHDKGDRGRNGYQKLENLTWALVKLAPLRVIARFTSLQVTNPHFTQVYS
jgi:hypothetical protein